MERVDQSGEESSFAFPLRGAVTALTAPQSGIEQVPHGIAEHVDAVDHNRQADTRPDGQSRRDLHVLAPLSAEHASPAGNAGWQTEPQKAQGSLGHDDAADGYREDDDDRRHDIGQHMP